MLLILKLRSLFVICRGLKIIGLSGRDMPESPEEIVQEKNCEPRNVLSYEVFFTDSWSLGV